MTVSGSIGLSFTSVQAGTYFPNTAAAKTPVTPANVTVSSSFIDAFLANVNTTITPAKRVIAIEVNTATGGNIQLGGVNGYNATANQTNCTVSTDSMVCSLGAVVATDAPSNSLAIDSDPHSISYFTANNTANNTFLYDSIRPYIVAPMSTFSWFNATFNFTNCSLVDDALYNVQTLTCVTTQNDLTKTNTKALYFVGTDRKGMSIKASDLTNNANTFSTFKVRFNKDNSSTTWVLGTDFLNSHTIILDYDQKSIIVTGGDVFAFIGTGAGSSRTVYIIVGIAVAVAAIAIAIVIYCCCCKKNEGDDYREQK
jgi:flagellar basal body-associated protein FliL